ncbi:15930_t:CDS:2 [Cetraspora pellucida]|uniref:15930_t:CDS:1 n=1 Tax=Cetraspora pellucida TaxID=1433469 RepID=A0A9N9ATZ9_9GLOM|nr:15930_t:CDS:2 [Cetraspora pellucida]
MSNYDELDKPFYHYGQGAKYGTHLEAYGKSERKVKQYVVISTPLTGTITKEVPVGTNIKDFSKTKECQKLRKELKTQYWKQINKGNKISNYLSFMYQYFK